MTGRERDPVDDRNKRLRNLSLRWAGYPDLQLGVYCRDVMELLRERDALAARLEELERIRRELGDAEHEQRERAEAAEARLSGFDELIEGVLQGAVVPGCDCPTCVAIRRRRSDT